MTNAKQDKFFDENYLTELLNQVYYVKDKGVGFRFEKSDRPFSKTIYINFYCNIGVGAWSKRNTLRVSDHLQPNCPHKQFIVKCDCVIDKKTRKRFMIMATATAKRALQKEFYRTIEKLSHN